MKKKEKINNLRKDIAIMKQAEIKPNYKALAKKHELDQRTVKKYNEGYEGKPSNRNKPSNLDKYHDEIKTKFETTTSKISSIFKFFENKYENIGSYGNFRYYCIKNEFIKDKSKSEPTPRYETSPGEQLQFDWVEDLHLYNKQGVLFEFNIFSAILGNSRLHSFIYSKYKTRIDVERCLVATYRFIGGVTKEILTDNMSSIVNTKSKQFYNEFKEFCKDMDTIPKNCKVRHPETKGKVESQNRFMDWLKPYNYEFETEEELIEIIKTVTRQTNNKVNETTRVKPILLFNKEKEYLKPLPSKEILNNYMYDLTQVKVPTTFLIKYKQKEYSVPHNYINKVVCIQELNNELYIYHNNNLIAKHQLSNSKINYDVNHYKEALKTKHVNESKIEEQTNKNLELLCTLC